MPLDSKLESRRSWRQRAAGCTSIRAQRQPFRTGLRPSVVRVAIAALLVTISGCGVAPAGLTPEPAPPSEPEVIVTGVKSPSAESVPTALAVDDRPKVYAVEGYEKIRLKPVWNAPIIGLIRAGQGVPLVSTTAITGYQVSNCKGGWYEVEPRGYVCIGKSSSLHREDPRVLAASEVLPDLDGAYPYAVGTMAADAPMYRRVPTRAEQNESEPGLAAHLARLPSVHEVFGSIDAAPAAVGPTQAFVEYIKFTKQGLRSEERAYQGRKIAWAKEFDAEGRTWLLTPDLTLIPKDKVYVGALPQMHGIDLREEKDYQLPLAYLWLEDSPKFVDDGAGGVVDSGETWPRHGFVPLTGKRVLHGGKVYWKTRDGRFIRHNDVTTIQRRSQRPPGVGPNDKWVQVRITWGFLVAYEGDEPVFATAISPGADGVTARANGHHTRRGRYHIGWKMFSGDMDGTENRVAWAVDEVPYVAYYKDSFALHGAWWHDDFGRPRSHGCINLSPVDARWMWQWMDPGMPEGWYAVTAFYPQVKGTLVDVGP